MFDFRHTIVRGRLVTAWESGLFALPGVLFMWAALVALHRLTLRGFEGNVTLVYVSICILFVAGLCLAGGRAGLIFAPKEGRWGYWVGLFRPVVCYWRPLGPVEKVHLETETSASGEKAFVLGFQGQKTTTLGATASEPVAFSVAESIATFLGKPLSFQDGQLEKSFGEPPFWGQLMNLLGGAGGGEGKVRPEKGKIPLPPHLTGLRGRGPLLLAIFMGVVLFLSWETEQLTRTLWGIAAAAFVICLCLWGLAFGLNALLRRGAVQSDKTGLALTVTGLLPQRCAFSWGDVLYLAILPPKKGFLTLAGRDSCVVAGAEQRSCRLGESLPNERLFGLHRYLLQQLRKNTR